MKKLLQLTGSAPGFSPAIIPSLNLTGNEFKVVLAFNIVTALLFVIAVRSLERKQVFLIHPNTNFCRSSNWNIINFY